MYAANLGERSSQRLGLLKTYKRIFSLNDEYLHDIKTTDDVFEYLREVSKQSRLLQPLSSQYFIEETGDIKILKGVRHFIGKET